MNKFQIAKIQSEKIEATIHDIQQELTTLALNKDHSGKYHINKILKKHNLLDKINFLDLAANIRSQTGQKDVVKLGINRFSKYQNSLKKIFNEFEIPEQLLAISFVESSFNRLAKSRVNASGAWQIMPIIAKHILPYNPPSINGSFSIPVSTLGAAHLLKENFRLLTQWDLTITAYNSGAKHLLIGKKEALKAGVQSPSLYDIINNYEHDHLGFASQNFYSEVLAMIHTLTYKDKIFNDLEKSKSHNINFYITGCNTTLSNLYKLYSLNENLHNELNGHIKDTKKTNIANILFTSTEDINYKDIKKLNISKLRRHYPKNAYKLIKSNQRCSIK